MTHARLGLFARTALALLVPFLLLQALVIGAFVAEVNLPLARRATDDLAALIVLAAQTWPELPPETRSSFEHELETNHDLKLVPAGGVTPGQETHLPYPALLQQALARRLGFEIHLYRSRNSDMYWVVLPTPEADLRIGFARDRIGVRPSRVLLVALAGMTLASILTALLLARWLTRPLERLARAAVKVGHGEVPAPLPETGPRELAALARGFNQMAHDAHELLQGRTTLLAGVSHDLRTPLARLRLALAMLPDSVEPSLLADIEHDIQDMDRLIGQHLDFARTMEPETPTKHDLNDIVNDAVDKIQRQGAKIDWHRGAPCHRLIAANALRRILTNLLSNAVRHGNGLAEIRLDCRSDPIVLEILDRGPGIDPAEVEELFAPFRRGRETRVQGSGLGLAIVRELARRNAWTVTLRPRKGRGTLARIEIPEASPTGNAGSP